MSIEHHVNLDEGDRDGMIDETKATETELPLQSQSALNWSWANKITRAAMATKEKKERERERNQRRPKEEYGKSVERKKKYLSEPYFEGSLVCVSAIAMLVGFIPRLHITTCISRSQSQ